MIIMKMKVLEVMGGACGLGKSSGRERNERAAACARARAVSRMNATSSSLGVGRVVTAQGTSVVPATT